MNWERLAAVLIVMAIIFCADYLRLISRHMFRLTQQMDVVIASLNDLSASSVDADVARLRKHFVGSTAFEEAVASQRKSDA